MSDEKNAKVQSVAMSAKDIKTILIAQYREGYACFPEFRTRTGYDLAHYIDFLAIGLWQKTWGIKSFEIKVNRSDFTNDASRFETKHADALEISNEFYYVCPWKLIGKDEVPARAGLMYIDSANVIKIVKQAPYQDVKAIPVYLIPALAEKFGTKIEVNGSVKFYGREVTAEVFEKEINTRLAKELKHKHDYELDRQVHERLTELKARETPAVLLLGKIKEAAGIWGDWDREKEQEIIRIVNLGQRAGRITGSLRDSVKQLDMLLATGKED
jgi:hypothetical protein